MRFIQTLTEKALDDIKVGEWVNIVRISKSFGEQPPPFLGPLTYLDDTFYPNRTFSNIYLVWGSTGTGANRQDYGQRPSLIETILVSKRTKRTFVFDQGGVLSKVNRYADFFNPHGEIDPYLFVIKDVEIIDYDEDDSDCI